MKKPQLLQLLAVLAKAEQPGSLHSLCVSSQSRLQLLPFARMWGLERRRLTRLGSLTVRGVLGELSLPSVVAGQYLSEMQLLLAHMVQSAQS